MCSDPLGPYNREEMRVAAERHRAWQQSHIEKGAVDFRTLNGVVMPVYEGCSSIPKAGRWGEFTK